MALTYAQAVEKLTGPGGPFEIETVTVDGRPQKNFKHRQRSLREKVAAAALHGDAECLIQGDTRIGYADFAKRVWGAAHALERDHGFRKGDRLAVFAYNSPDWIISLFGATSLGGIGVGLNGWWVPEEVEYGLRDSGSRFLVVDERLYPRVSHMLGEIDSLERVFYIGDSPPPETTPIAELLIPADTAPTVEIDEQDPFVILYTSGTTGRPKGCITTHGGTITQVQGIVLTGAITALTGNLPEQPAPDATPAQAAALLTSPLFHVGGLHCSVCTALTVGSKLVFNRGKFDPEEAMQLIEREKINTWGAIPTLLHRVVNSPAVAKYDLSSLRGISFGAAPTPPETIEKARAILPVEPSFTNLYGLTETHGVATANAGKTLLGRKTSAGRVLPFLDLQIVDEKGHEVATGQLGEIRLSGPTITPGYWNRPEATAETVRDGWLRTGDLGYVDDEGFLFIADRAKDMILRGGENVYCVEIENCLAAHPEIDEAAIIGVPDTELGEKVKAVVRRKTGSSLDEVGVKRHVAAHLATFKVPEFVEFTDQPLPRNPAGKLLKNVLRGTGAVAFDPDSLE